MGYLIRIKAGIEQGRQDVIRAREEKEKQREKEEKQREEQLQAEQRQAVREARENPGRITKIGIALGKTAQHMDPARVVVVNSATRIGNGARNGAKIARTAAINNAPKIGKGIAAIALSAAGETAAPSRKKSRKIHRTQAQHSSLPDTGFSFSPNAGAIVDDLLLPPVVQQTRPKRSSSKNKKKEKKRSTPHTLDDDLLFGGGGFLF